MYTTFWFQGSSYGLKFVKALQNTLSEEDEKAEDSAEVGSLLINYGLIDCWKTNSLYKLVIEKYRVIEYTNEDITELHHSWYETANTDKRVRQDSARRESKDEDLTSVSEEVDIWKNACVEVVYLSTVRRWSIS